jgi:DNA repair exonuclease SbcCD nuclease subunit
MNFNFIEESSKKIGIFTDCHWGINRDNQERLKETTKCINWIIKTFKKEKVDYVIFCGDLFDSRFSINVQTLNAAINSIESLAYSFEKVFLIVGNHDTFYKNINTVNSVKFLEKLTQTENLIIVEDEPYFIMIQDKILGLFPWRI